MIDIVNLTPHAIIVDDGVTQTTYAPSGVVARVTQEATVVGEVNGYKVKRLVSVGDNIPAPINDTIYLVSAMVLGQSERSDLVAPNTNEAKRNEKGHIASVPGFVSK